MMLDESWAYVDFESLLLRGNCDGPIVWRAVLLPRLREREDAIDCLLTLAVITA